MQELPLIIKAMIVGFSVAAPVGPIAIVCINRTLSGGKRAGIAAGLGAAIADTLYGLIAASGVAIVANFLHQHRLIFKLFGGVILIVLGLRTFLAKPSNQIAVTDMQSLIQTFVTTLLLTLSNPLTIFAFFASFAAINLQSEYNTFWTRVLIVLGVFIGAVFWWFLLTQFVGHFYRSVSAQKLKLLNTFSGIVIMIFGMALLIELAIKISTLH